MSRSACRTPLPPLPPSGTFRINASAAFLAERTEGLQRFLDGILEADPSLSTHELRCFLGSVGKSVLLPAAASTMQHGGSPLSLADLLGPDVEQLEIREELPRTSMLPCGLGIADAITEHDELGFSTLSSTILSEGTWLARAARLHRANDMLEVENAKLWVEINAFCCAELDTETKAEREPLTEEFRA